MEWKLYLRHRGISYRILKIRQGANLDITIIPKNSIYFYREIIEDLDFNDQIQLKYESLGGKIDHYSAHALSGQRHIKLDPTSPALEPTIGLGLREINRPIPLITIVATANKGSQEVPSSGKWMGFQLADDMNYIIMELTAMPKDAEFEIHKSYTVQNTKASQEKFDLKAIEMRNCFIVAFMRMTNHELTDIEHNVVFQQVEGKTIDVIRVENGAVIAQVMQLDTK